MSKHFVFSSLAPLLNDARQFVSAKNDADSI